MSQAASFAEESMAAAIGDQSIRHVQTLLRNFRSAVQKKRLQSLWHVLQEFEKTTDTKFNVSSWPLPETVSTELELKDTDDDQLFFFLYKELFYRHIFHNVPEQITPQKRVLSWQNYINLFNYFDREAARWSDQPEDEEGDEIDYTIVNLPNVWIWQIVSSFVEQFASFHEWNIEGSDSYGVPVGTWSAIYVLRYLAVLCENGHVPLRFEKRMDAFMDDDGKDENIVAKAAAVDAGAAFVPNTLRMLGLFSLVGLLKVNTLICDYRTAIECIDPIDLRSKSALTKIQECNMTIHYYLSFCYMMVGRLVDSSRISCSFIARHMRDRQKLPEKFQLLYGKAHTMLVITYSVSPSKIEDKSIIEPLREQFANSFQIFDAVAPSEDGTTTTDDDGGSATVGANSSVLDDKRNGEYVRLFRDACPHFLDLADGRDEKDGDEENRNSKLLDQQCNLFVSRICQSRYRFGKHKKALKYFGAVPVTRLCSAMNQKVDEASTGAFHLELLQLKRKMRQFRRFDGAVSSGEWYSETDFDFFIHEDMVHVRELKVERMGKYTNHFINNIKKLKDVVSDLGRS